MLTEGLGGYCPNCHYTKMLQRYGSSGYYQLDYCARCGFGYAYAQGQKNEGDLGDKVLEAVLEAHTKILKEAKFPITRKGLYDWIESITRKDGVQTSTNVFAYSEADVDVIMYNVKDKDVYGDETVIFH